MSGHRQFVLRTVEERGVKFVRLWFIDVLGLLKSLSIPVSEL
ncbi:MAG: glutamine synthetase, partial [bacterium]